MVLSGYLPPLVRLARVAFLPALLACLQAATPAEIAGTLPEDYFPELKPILALAVQRSPDAIVRVFDVETNDARLLEANATRLPRFGGNFNYASNETSTTADTSSRTRDNGFFYNFGLNQEIFHWNALKNQRLAARLNRLVAEKSYALAYRQVCVSLRQLFLGLIVEKAALQESRAALAQVDRELKVLDLRRQQGSVSSSAYEGEKFRRRETQLVVSRAEETFAASRRRFARLAGVSSELVTEAFVPDDIPKPRLPLDSAQAMAAEFLRDNGKGSHEWQIYDLRLKEAVTQQKIQDVRLYPRFGAGVGYSLENTTNVNTAGGVEQKAVARQSISIGGSWDIFDGFRTRAAKQQALINKRSIEYRMTLDMEDLLQRVQQLERTLRLDAELLDISDVRQSMATMARDHAKQEADRGNLAPADVERAENGLLQARARNLAARANFLSNWAEFVATAGEDPMLSNLPARYVRGK